MAKLNWKLSLNTLKIWIDIWRTKNNYHKSWNGITDVKDRIIEWFDEVSKKNFGVSNLKRMIMAWNDGNPTNEIDEQFTE